MGNVITVSRQFGSLGRPVAKAVAEKLGYKFLDPEILEEAAKRLNMSTDELKAYDGQQVIKQRLDGSKYCKMAFPFGSGDERIQKKLFEAEERIMMEEADKGDVVIVGRAADYLFSKAGREKLLRIHIEAPYDHRFDNCINELKLSKIDAREHIEVIDQARNIFYKKITGENFNSPIYRDIIINMENMSLDEAVDMIVYMAERKFGK